MTPKNDYRTIFYSLLGIFIFSCINSVNIYNLKLYLLINKGLSGEEINHISQTKFLGSIISSFALTQVINKFSNKQIILTSLILLIICTINLILLNNYNLLRLNFILINSGIFAYFTATILHIIESAKNKKYLFLASVMLLWACGHLTVSLLSPFIEPTNTIIIICALLYSINILTEFLHYNPTTHTLKINSKFSSLIRNIELQLLTGFVVSYVTLDILWYYEAFALREKLALINLELILTYIFIAIIISIIPISYILNKVNKYFANLLLTLILLTCFILLSFHGTSKTFNIIYISIIGSCLVSIFICNILILIDKFREYELRTALFSYFSMCTIGIYAGALSSYIPFGIVNNNDFLFSIFSVVGSFVVYHLWYFIRYRLYKR
ncbi:MAG TPA: MFS transporter [Rickettsia endosymbiont of Pyrocoelia pectoralis]|nr:MFS transporter [Rickettsia endosymbiont of Pyrocoelia pectoralis]